MVPSPQTRRWLLSWLCIGLWVGFIDGYLSLRLLPAVAGDASLRLGAILLSMAFDAVALLAVVLVLHPVARFFGWATRSAAVRWFRALFGGGVLGAIAFLLVEEAQPAGSLPGVSWKAALILIAVGSLSIAVILWLLPKRFGASATGRWGPALRRLPLWLAASAVACGLGTFLGWQRPAVAEAGARPNIILISLDTLRADHLGCYGYGQDTSPVIDRWAQGATLFENAYAQSHWTLPSHASMLTGVSPLALALVADRSRLSPQFTTLAERLEGDGYRAGAFVGGDASSYIGKRRGFAQGFADYVHPPYPHPLLRGLLLRTGDKVRWSYVHHKTGTAKPQIAQALKWLTWHQETTFFLFLHLFDIHSDIHRLPYEEPAPFQTEFLSDPPRARFSGCGPNGHCASELLRDYGFGNVDTPMAAADLEDVISYYDGGIAYADDALGGLFDTLEALNLSTNTVVILTSDHGEEFFEHGKPLHLDLYDESLHVPLLIRLPEQESAAKSAELVQLVDLVPTVLDLAGLEKTGILQGRSLTPFLGFGGEEADSAATPAQILHPRSMGFAVHATSIRTEHWKYICSTGKETRAVIDPAAEHLYDLAADPGEEHNLLPAEEPACLAQFREILRLELAAARDIQEAVLRSGEDGSLQLDARQLQRLKSLGYIE